MLYFLPGNRCSQCLLACLQAAFFEALCQDINPQEQTVVACFPPDSGIFPPASGMDESCFKIPYDILVLGERLPPMTCFVREYLPVRQLHTHANAHAAAIMSLVCTLTQSGLFTMERLGCSCIILQRYVLCGHAAHPNPWP